MRLIVSTATEVEATVQKYLFLAALAAFPVLMLAHPLFAR